MILIIIHMINNLVVHVRAEVNYVVISNEQLNIVLEQHKIRMLKQLQMI